MNKHRIIRRLVIALLALVAAGALALGGAYALSYLIYGRSPQASAYEIILRRRFATDVTAEQETARLDALRGQAESDIHIPGLVVGIERHERDGMAWYLINPDGNTGVTVFYLHGGAYIHRLNAYQWELMRTLAEQTDARIVAPDYHVAPYGNCTRAYADVPALFAEYAGANPGERIVMMGDSAGGGLALGVSEYLLDAGGPIPERLILFSPWVDLSMDNPDIADYVAVEPVLHFELVKVHGRVWADERDVHDWMVSPLFGDMEGLPPVTVYAGTRELLYPDLVLLRDRLAAAGVDVTFRVGRGLNHEYPLMPLPESRAAVREVIRVIEEMKD